MVQYRPTMLSAAEDPQERICTVGSFGVSGMGWATAMGITLGDELVQVRGRYWWRGLGNWKIPFGRHPIPLSFQVLLRVKSPTFVETDSRFLRGTQPIGLVQQRFDAGEAAAYARAQVSELGEGESHEIEAALSKIFWVYDD